MAGSNIYHYIEEINEIGYMTNNDIHRIFFLQEIYLKDKYTEQLNIGKKNPR